MDHNKLIDELIEKTMKLSNDEEKIEKVHIFMDGMETGMKICKNKKPEPETPLT